MDGRDYHFITEVELEKYRATDWVIESRTYNTAHGPWVYATVEDKMIDDALVSHNDSVLMIGTLESFKSVRDRYGADSAKGLYIECTDGDRLQRALDREKGESTPKYKEM